MNVLFVASEVDPFAKTGGLADVAAALPRALAKLGHDVRVMLPLYRAVNRQQCGVRATDLRVSVSLGAKTLEVRLWEATLPNSAVPVYCLEQAALFDRDGLYQDRGKDFPDNLERFSVFSQAALQLLPRLPWQPEILHAHDWQAALACAHLAFGPLGHEPFFSSMGTVLTVHNLAYQGVFPAEQWALTQLPKSAFSLGGLEFYDHVNCLKGGLVSAGALTTVSPTYAREIQTPEFGCGLEGVLGARRDVLFGILNGIDLDDWNPATDPHLPAHYAPGKGSGKSLCKAALQRSQRLPEQQDLLIGMIQRLAEQKGIDIFLDALDVLLAMPLQIVILGTGDPQYHQALEQVAAKFPSRLVVNLTFDNALAHQIEAGADAFLMPSRFEPCGLNQMYSMRYGTVPIVRRVGGLADTVVDMTPATLADRRATGFVIGQHSAAALAEAVKRAVTAYRDRGVWTDLIRIDMEQDCSWGRSAQEYVRVYERALGDVARRATPKAVGSR